LEIFGKKSADIELALLDVSLPGKTGIELAHALLRIKPDLKILFISGYVGAEVIRMHGMSLRDRHFLRKPFRADELVSRVHESLKSFEPLSWANSPKTDDAEEEADDCKS
jgi:two-component system cell cycle sensor histidine kinase/response regulator CckA